MARKPAESEADFQTWVEGMLATYGWRYAHIRDSRGQNTDGIADLIAVHRDPPGLLYLELKSARGNASPLQEEWMADMEAVATLIPRQMVASFARPVQRPVIEDYLKAFRLTGMFPEAG